MTEEIDLLERALKDEEAKLNLVTAKIRALSARLDRTPKSLEATRIELQLEIYSARQQQFSQQDICNNMRAALARRLAAIVSAA